VVKREELAPGQEGLLWLETEVPPVGAGADFTLELDGATGNAPLVIPVKLPARTQEGKR